MTPKLLLLLQIQLVQSAKHLPGFAHSCCCIAASMSAATVAVVGATLLATTNMMLVQHGGARRHSDSPVKFARSDSKVVVRSTNYLDTTAGAYTRLCTSAAAAAVDTAWIASTNMTAGIRTGGLVGRQPSLVVRDYCTRNFEWWCCCLREHNE